MEKKTRLRRMALGILTLGSLLMVYPMLDIGSAKRTNAQIIDPANMAKHNTPGDCWLAVNNKVYNVTNFLSRHSGGASAIIPYCGKDATAAFSGKPHPGSDLAALSAYYIGDIGVVPPPPPPNPAPHPQPDPEISPVISKIIISPEIIEMKIGDTELFKAAAYDQNNRPMAGAIIVYSSSDPGVGNIDAGGSFHAQSAGSVLITASSGQVRSTASVKVKKNQPLPVPAASPAAQAVYEMDLLKKRCEEIFGNNENDDEDDRERMKEERRSDDRENENEDEEKYRPKASGSGDRTRGHYVM